MRYLTKRFIGEYDHHTGNPIQLNVKSPINSFKINVIIENRYKHEAMINGEPVIFEIVDTCPKVFAWTE